MDHIDLRNGVTLAIEKAASRAYRERGGVVELAALLGITPQAISQWERVPVDHVAKISVKLGIPRRVLRPDIFGARGR